VAEGDGFDWLPALLVLQGVMGALDTIVNHELLEALPQNERALHVFLTLNFGALVALLAPVLAGWGANPTELAPAYHGWMSWALAALGLASAGWSLRDLVASRRLKLEA
jgi:MFS family permease